MLLEAALRDSLLCSQSLEAASHTSLSREVFKEHILSSFAWLPMINSFKLSLKIIHLLLLCTLKTTFDLSSNFLPPGWRESLRHLQYHLAGAVINWKKLSLLKLDSWFLNVAHSCYKSYSVLMRCNISIYLLIYLCCSFIFVCAASWWIMTDN